MGLVIASGMVRADTDPPDPAQLAEASRLVAEGRGDELVRIPNRSFASYISAATFLEGANSSPEFKDFFGVHTPHPAATRIRCPILAFSPRGMMSETRRISSCSRPVPSAVEWSESRGDGHDPEHRPHVPGKRRRSPKSSRDGRRLGAPGTEKAI